MGYFWRNLLRGHLGDRGEVAERPNAGALKASEVLKPPGVQIPPSPQKKTIAPCGLSFFYCDKRRGIWEELAPASDGSLPRRVNGNPHFCGGFSFTAI